MLNGSYGFSFTMTCTDQSNTLPASKTHCSKSAFFTLLALHGGLQNKNKAVEGTEVMEDDLPETEAEPELSEVNRETARVFSGL